MCRILIGLSNFQTFGNLKSSVKMLSLCFSQKPINSFNTKIILVALEFEAFKNHHLFLVERDSLQKL